MRFFLLGTAAVAALTLGTTPMLAQPAPGSPGLERRGGPGGGSEAERETRQPGTGAERGRPERPERPGAAQAGPERDADDERPGRRPDAPGRVQPAQGSPSPAERPERPRAAEPAQPAQPARPSAAERPEPARPTNPRAAEPATPSTPARPGTAERPEPTTPRQTGENPGQQRPRAAEPTQPATPGASRTAEPQSPSSPATPARPQAAEPAQPTAPGAQPSQRAAEPATPSSPARPTPTQNTQPATPATPSPVQAQPGQSPAGTVRPTQAQPATSQESPSNPANVQTSPTSPERRAVVEGVERQIEQRRVRPETNIGVTITTGASLPERVRVYDLPQDVVRTRPEYRNYGFVVTERETVIVDPRTRRVVEVIDRRGGPDGGIAYEREGRLVETIETRHDTRVWRSPRAFELRRDVVLPQDAPLYELPDEYIEHLPNYRGYRFVQTEDEIAIVEPRSRRVVQVVEKEQARRSRTAQAQAPAAAPRAPRADTRATGTAGGFRGSAGDALNLSPEQREEINRAIIRSVGPGTLASINDLVGATLPESIQIWRMPPEAAERVAELRDMGFVLIGDDVLIVDPSTRRVVDVIE